MKRTIGLTTMLLIGLFTLALAGCGARGPDHTPVINPDQGKTPVASVEPAAASTPVRAVDPGRDEPLSLDDAIALALQRNPDIRAAAERIGEAEAQVGEATAAFYPQVAARLGYARTDNPAQAFAMILNQRRFSFDLDFNNPGPTQNVRPEIAGAISLFRGGQDFERREASLDGVEAARLERLAVRNALTDAVIAAYYALLTSPEQVETTLASIQAVSSALEQARARFAAGSALKSDVLSLEVRLAEAQEGHVRATNGVELARTGLRTILALSAEAPLEVAPVPAAPESQPATFSDALARALAGRPELTAAARQVAMREHEVKMERAAYFPRIDAIGSFGNDSSDFELTHNQDSWFVGAAAEIDVFSGFRTRERVRAAEQRLAEAREAERKVHLDVERDVRTAFLAFEEARQRAAVAVAAVASAEDALRLVQEQYGAGVVTITRYLEAEAARAAARSRAIAARYDVRRADAALKKAMGVWAQERSGTE